MKDIVSLEKLLEKLYEWVTTRGINAIWCCISIHRMESH